VPLQGQAFYLTGANGHVQTTSTGTADVKTITLEPSCHAIMVSARTTAGILTFNGSTPSSSNGLDVSAGANPTLLPLGYNLHGGHQLKWASSAAANAVLNVQQMS
jgi:hypothetical protein